jgi:phosphoribosyl-AMP cyclohydrolase
MSQPNIDDVRNMLGALSPRAREMLINEYINNQVSESPESSSEVVEEIPEIKNINIGVKPPQSGKTKEFIINPTLENIMKGILPIIIVPSRISLEKQTTQRFIDETFEDEDEDDDSFYTVMDEEEEDFENLVGLKRDFINNAKNIKEEHVGRFDTGIPKEFRLEDPKDVMKKYKNGDIRLIIVLDNSQGIKKLCSLLHYINAKIPDQGVAIIVDEIHNILNLKFTKDEQEDYMEELDMLKSNLERLYSRKGFVKPKNFHQRKVINMLWMIDTLKRKNNWTFNGTTATTTPIVVNKYIRNLGLSINTVHGNIPETYYGYEKMKKMYYKGDISMAFSKIIIFRENVGFVCVMFHSGRYNDCHTGAGNCWIDTCIDNNINWQLIAYMTDNQHGYNIYDGKKRLVNHFPKDKVDEPWKVVEYMQERYNYTGIFGDISMSESNTYQKCNEEHNVIITDLVVKDLEKQPIKKMTSIIQKVGRIFTNDTINTDFERVLWFYRNSKKNANDKVFYEVGMKIEACIQTRSREVNMLELDYNNIKREVKRGNIGLDGKIIENNEDIILEQAAIHFPVWSMKSSDKIISKFMRSIDIHKIYNKNEIKNLIKESGSTNEETMLNNLQKINSGSSNGYGELLEKKFDRYRFKKCLRPLYNRYFNN